MCGIVGYTGPREAYPIIIKGLKRLEYRGYDSTGVALQNGGLKVYKKKGKVADLEDSIVGKDLHGHVGIGHTRWATHGEPSDLNAHPHDSSSGKLAMIHNGIIENYTQLKKELGSKGYEFRSETDTEVLLNFIEEIKKNNKCDLEEAVRVALKRVTGAYVILLLVEDHPDTATVMTLLLKSLGHGVEMANGVARALELAEKQSFDLVISDLGLPDGSGLELMRLLGQKHGLKGVAISGYGMEADLADSKDAGFIAHLTKPVNFQQVRALLSQFACTNG